MSLDAWAARQESRCACGFNVATQGCHCTGSEWQIFLAALSTAARDGEVHQSDVRPLIRGRVAPKRIGQAYRRAVREDLLAEAGHERSNDELGRNAGRMEPYYTYLPATSARKAA